MKPSLAYPVSPISINQAFGQNLAYYETNFGQKGHPGIDFKASHGQPVYAAHDGAAIYIKDAHGGEGIWNYADGFITIYWHLIGDTDVSFLPPIPFASNGVRTRVKRGDLIGYADNTGAPFESTGDHLHFGLLLTDANGIILNQDNGTQGCIDPEPYFDGTFANSAQNEPTAADVGQDLTQVEAALENAPTPEIQALAAKALALIKQMVPFLFS
jgi:murein DD-endopeptidase MepM/ murein hydrolase activator NlpD